MFNKLFENNPLGILMLCASIVGSGYVMNYRLDSIDKSQHDMAEDIDTIQKDVGDLQNAVSALKAVNEYKEKLEGH
ncbi:hypothetical protein AB733_22940 [Photobacterium swingsii]|uniref:TMhelix containing protein n=1 Tax=Photobacterium swingsii TaxID=680026 RepID=A0A0J8XT38_9GAMM|nr:hypothetical protein [Photobacterium swingsii]KMV28539.1 hypothetical protein AB733_22940 [Photobacterium swingsii]PSW24505.1 hypothetical protein C9I94_10740 [Photobacterium swingsii]